MGLKFFHKKDETVNMLYILITINNFSTFYKNGTASTANSK